MADDALCAMLNVVIGFAACQSKKGNTLIIRVC